MANRAWTQQPRIADEEDAILESWHRKVAAATRHNGGFAGQPLMEDGTLSLKPANKASGYWVGVRGYEIVLPWWGPENPLWEAALSALVRKALIFQDIEELFVGCWVDGKRIVLDLCVWAATEEEARERGARENQISIFDIAADEVTML